MFLNNKEFGLWNFEIDIFFFIVIVCLIEFFDKVSKKC